MTTEHLSPSSLERATARPGVRPEPSAVLLLATLLKNWRRLTGFTLTVGAFTAGLTLLLPPTYEATFSFFPQAKSGTKLPSSLAGLAGQFGVSLGDEPTQSPQFYVALLTSRAILKPVLFGRYHTPASTTPSDSVALIDFYQVTGQTTAQRTDNGLRRLSGSVSASIDALTGIVTVRVGAPDPTLASAVAERLFEQLNEFNIEARQAQARERTDYSRRASADAAAALHKAEDSLQGFYARNRQYQTSPSLTFEEQRLHRQVDIAQDLYVSLVRQYQAAEVDQANDVPVLVPIDGPVPPVKRSKPKRRALVLVSMFLAFTVISAVVVLDEYQHRALADDAASWSLVLAAWDDIKQTVRRVLRLSR